MNELGMHREEHDMLIAAVEAAREYAQGVAEINRTILWDVLDFTRIVYGHQATCFDVAEGASLSWGSRAWHNGRVSPSMHRLYDEKSQLAVSSMGAIVGARGPGKQTRCMSSFFLLR